MKRIIEVIIAISALSGLVAFVVEQTHSLGKKGESGHKPFGIYEKYIKRPLDCFLSTGALIVLSPILLITALLVRIKLGSPVLFSQQRPGRNEKIFKLYKFRSMTDERDSSGNLLPDEDRLPKFGKRLRSTSLDELPELLNIIKGDMAIIGPRPLLVQYLPWYSDEQRHRHDVRPGLTGYAQAHGRNAVSWDEKFRMDTDYVSHITFRGDMRIIFDTIKTVVRHEGISSATSVTMEGFVDYCKGKGREPRAEE